MVEATHNAASNNTIRIDEHSTRAVLCVALRVGWQLCLIQGYLGQPDRDGYHQLLPPPIPQLLCYQLHQEGQRGDQEGLVPPPSTLDIFNKLSIIYRIGLVLV